MNLLVPDYGCAAEWRVPLLVGEIQMESQFLLCVIRQVLESALNQDEKEHPPLSVTAAQQFERLAEEIAISTPTEIAAMHWYMTLPFTRSTLIDLLERGIPVPVKMINH